MLKGSLASSLAKNTHSTNMIRSSVLVLQKINLRTGQLPSPNQKYSQLLYFIWKVAKLASYLATLF